MFLNGAMIGMIAVIIQRVQVTIHKDQVQARSAFYAAAVGSSMLTTVALPIATASVLAAATTT